jgi:PHS family inorganic phosphate transporter-like MFS transporter
MIGKVYGAGGALTANQDLGLKVATPVGTFVGQLLFGWLASVSPSPFFLSTPLSC